MVMPVLAALRDLGVRHHIGGSVASSLLGVARSTVDVDIVADLRAVHVAPLVAALEAEFYVVEAAVREALRERSSFNAVHFEEMYKVDVFVPKSRPFARQVAERAGWVTLSQQDQEVAGVQRLPVSSAEDIILHKLEWYRAGHELSERQWLDVLNVLKVQAGNLEHDYMTRWAAELGVSDLLERAVREAVI